MNTVGKYGHLGGSIRCVVSVSMLTEGWDANTVTHVLGIRAFSTQLLCEQVIGRALRRQSYDLNEKELFNVEYADVFGIPFDFTAKPVVAPPQPPRETIQVKAVRPDRDALEIRFPRVEGYRVELPEERLVANFNDDSVLELTPDLVGPSITRNSGIIGEGVDLGLKHLGDMRPSDAAVQPDATPSLHQMARSRRRAKATPVRSAQAHHQAMAGHLPRLQGRYLSRVAHVSGAGRYGLQPHHRRNHPQRSRASVRSRPCSIPTIPSARLHTSTSTHPGRDRWETDRTTLPCQLGHPRQRLGRRVLSRGGIASEGSGLREESQPRAGSAVPLRLGDAEVYRPTSSCWWTTGTATTTFCTSIVEIKGYRGEDAKEKKSTMETYWVPGVNHLGTYGRWAFAEFTEVYQIEADFKAKVEGEFQQDDRVASSAKTPVEDT